MLSKSAKQTHSLGQTYSKRLNPGDVVALFGELGGGKTVFVKGIASGIGIKQTILSPTYTISKIYRGKKNLAHFDFYRVEKPDQLLSLELLDLMASGEYIVVIEWAERVRKFLPTGTKKVSFEHAGLNTRRISTE